MSAATGSGDPQARTVSVVIPAYNEEATVASVITEALDSLQPLCKAYEVIVADDASTDGTRRILDDLARTHPCLRVIHNPRNLGTAETSWALYRVARYDWICSLPADGQVRPTELPRLLEGLKRWDVIVGHRTSRVDPWYRLVSAWLWNLAVRVLLGLSVKDIDSVKVYPKQLVASIEVTSRGAFMEAEILCHARALGYRLGNVPVAHHARRSGKASGVSRRIIRDALGDLVRFRLNAYRRGSAATDAAARAERGRWQLLILIVMALLLFFSSAGARGLEGDEVNYAAIAKRMLERGDWMTPYFFRSKEPSDLWIYVEPETGMVPMWQKTPFGIWLIAASVKAFGQSEFAVRLPAALLGTAIVGVTYAWAMLLTGSAWAALLAGIVLLTSQPFLVIGQSYVYDSACILFMMLAVYCHFTSIQRDRRTALLVGPLLGLAFFAKPFVPLLALPVLLAHLARRRGLAACLNGYLWLGLLLGILVNAPWFAYEYSRYGQPFLKEFLLLTVGTGVQFIGLPYPDDFFYRNHPLYYLKHLLVFYLPWILLLPAAVRHCLAEEHADVGVFALLWAAVFLVAFSAARSRLPHYIGPIYPVLAIPLGIYLFRLGRGAALGRAVLLMLIAMAAVRIGYLTYALLASPDARSTIPWGVRWWVGLTATLGVASLLVLAQKTKAVTQTAAVCVATYLISLGVTTSYHLYRSRVEQKDVRDYIAGAGPDARIIGVAEEDLSRLSNSLYWHFGKIPFATEPTGLKRFLHARSGRVFIIADGWGARIVSAAVPEAAVKLKFRDGQPLFLFELQPRRAG